MNKAKEIHDALKEEVEAIGQVQSFSWYIGNNDDKEFDEEGYDADKVYLEIEFYRTHGAADEAKQYKVLSLIESKIDEKDVTDRIDGDGEHGMIRSWQFNL